MDLPVPVLQERHREPHRELRRIGAVHRIAEGELVEEDPVLRVELPFLDMVLEAQGELPFLDSVPRVPSGVGGQGRQVHVPEIHLEIEEEIFRQGIDFPDDLQRRRVLQLPAQVDVRKPALLGGETGDASADLDKTRGVVRLDVLIAEVHFAALQRHRVDPDGDPGRLRRVVRGRGRRAGFTAALSPPALSFATIPWTFSVPFGFTMIRE